MKNKTGTLGEIFSLIQSVQQHRQLYAFKQPTTNKSSEQTPPSHSKKKQIIEHK
jgi:hypothetical protein